MIAGCASPNSETDDGSSVVSGCSPKGSSEATKFLRAAGVGDLEQVMRVLANTGASVDTLRARGSTALHEASKSGHLPVVSELVRRCATVDAVNRNGCTALHFAVLCKDKHRVLEVAQFLLDSGAGINVTSERMDTPLHFATYCPVAQGLPEVLKLLISRKASVNARNRNSESPLINAVLNENAEAVQVIVEAGANIHQKNSMEMTAIDIARERGCQDVVRVLETAKDPMVQLKDVAQQMRTALNQMQTVDTLSDELRCQTETAEAFESVAGTVVAKLSAGSRMRLLQNALTVFQDGAGPCQQLGRASGPPAVASSPMSEHRVLQALVSVLLVARSSGGAELLQLSGILDALPQIELRASSFHTGHKELRELRHLLSRAQADTADVPPTRSGSSTPSSATEAASQVSLLTRNTGISAVTGCKERSACMDPARGHKMGFGLSQHNESETKTILVEARRLSARSNRSSSGRAQQRGKRLGCDRAAERGGWTSENSLPPTVSTISCPPTGSSSLSAPQEPRTSTRTTLSGMGSSHFSPSSSQASPAPPPTPTARASDGDETLCILPPTSPHSYNHSRASIVKQAVIRIRRAVSRPSTTTRRVSAP